MEHQSSFLTGFLTGQRLKLWRTGFASGDVPGGGTNFYDWAGQSGAPQELTDPDAYAQYLDSLPITRLMDGKYIWQVALDDVTQLELWHYYIPDTSRSFSPARSDGFSYHCDNSYVKTDFYPVDERSFRYYSHRTGATRIICAIRSMRITVPVSGLYKQLATTVFKGTRIYYESRSDYTGLYLTNSKVDYHAGQGMGVTSSSMDAHLFDGYMFLPVFEVQLSDPSGVTDIRPGILSGSPINENAKTFTNPITGEIISFESFSYDYKSRTYTLTLPGGNKMDVMFADDTIKITEGLGGGEINVEGETVEAMYPDNAGAPIVAPDGAFQKEAFLSGLAAGMASQGL